MNDDLIIRQAVLDILEREGHKWGNDYRDWVDAVNEVETLPSVNPQEPCGETVSLEAFKQVMWERDIAIEQLKELGYGFGQKIEPKTGHWIGREKGVVMPFWERVICSECKSIGEEDFNYCPNCGCRMVEPQESEE